MFSLRNLPLVCLLSLAVVPACKGRAGARASHVALGADHGCALLESGDVECWGFDGRGQLGQRSPGAAADASADAGANTDAGANADAGANTDAGTSTGGDAGADGGLLLPVKPPAKVQGLRELSGIAAGGSNSCALLANGDVRCWGENEDGELGSGAIGTGGFQRAPVLVDAVHSASSVAVGLTHSCALEQDGTVVCWGYDDAGDLGDPAHPVQGATAVAVGAHHSCAVVDQGVVCWGDNTIGQLGAADGNAILPLSAVVGVAAGGNETCALDADGSVQCWGSLDPACTGGCGQAPAPVNLTGTATKVAVEPAGLVGATTKLTTASSVACALLDNGTIECWDRTGVTSPVQGVAGATDFDLGAGFGCAVLDDASVVCWGDNTLGQLGDGTTAKHTGLVKVKL